MKSCGAYLAFTNVYCSGGMEAEVLKHTDPLTWKKSDSIRREWNGLWAPLSTNPPIDLQSAVNLMIQFKNSTLEPP